MPRAQNIYKNANVKCLFPPSMSSWPVTLPAGDQDIFLCPFPDVLYVCKQICNKRNREMGLPSMPACA